MTHPVRPPVRGPDFLVIGSAKSGTTALDEFLRTHPELRFPALREPNHFAFVDSPPTFRDHRGRPAPMVHTTITDRRTYLDSFPEPTTDTRSGETSPAYLYVPGTAERIAAMRPDARLIAILREPGTRAFSAFQHLRREGREPLDFADALMAEPRRIQEGWGLLWRYVDTGRYAQQLQRYLDVFPREQLLLLRHEELSRDPAGTCRRAFRFLGVDPDAPVDVSARFNVSGVPRNRVVHMLANPPARLRAMVARLAPPSTSDRLRTIQARVMNRNLQRTVAAPAALRRVRIELQSELDHLEELTGWDLADWRP